MPLLTVLLLCDVPLPPSSLQFTFEDIAAYVELGQLLSADLPGVPLYGYTYGDGSGNDNSALCKSTPRVQPVRSPHPGTSRTVCCRPLGMCTFHRHRRLAHTAGFLPAYPLAIHWRLCPAVTSLQSGLGAGNLTDKAGLQVPPGEQLTLLLRGVRAWCHVEARITLCALGNFVLWC